MKYAGNTRARAFDLVRLTGGGAGAFDQQQRRQARLDRRRAAVARRAEGRAAPQLDRSQRRLPRKARRFYLCVLAPCRGWASPEPEQPRCMHVWAQAPASATTLRRARSSRLGGSTARAGSSRRRTTSAPRRASSSACAPTCARSHLGPFPLTPVPT
jgi:hypothetical protein